jgi:hypothetical protein
MPPCDLAHVLGLSYAVRDRNLAPGRHLPKLMTVPQ